MGKWQSKNGNYKDGSYQSHKFTATEYFLDNFPVTADKLTSCNCLACLKPSRKADKRFKENKG